MTKFQTTIENPFSISGTGMHSGKSSQITVRPAPADTGIVFIKSHERIKASVENVVGTKLGTSLRGIKVVEHFLAAAAGLGIDNLEVEVEGEEIPILDGSALPYVKAFKRAKIIEQKVEKRFFEIKEKISLKEENKNLTVLPYDGFKIYFMVNYPGVGEQSFLFDPHNCGGDYAEVFEREIAPARTFGYVENLQEMQAQGFALGASVENALAITKEGYLNTPRFQDEIVRHKILDLIGDLCLAGQPVRAEIIAHQSGHRLNVELVRRLLKK